MIPGDGEVAPRKVLFTAGMSNDYMIIITDAPVEALEEWCRNYNREMEDGKNTYFDSLKKGYYVKVLADSEVDDFDIEDLENIGYDESYDLFDYANVNLKTEVNYMKVLKEFHFKKNTPLGLNKLVGERSSYIGSVHAVWSTIGWMAYFVPGAPVEDEKIGNLLDTAESIGNVPERDMILNLSKALFGTTSSLGDIDRMCSEYCAYEGVDELGFSKYVAYACYKEAYYIVRYRIHNITALTTRACECTLTILRKPHIPAVVSGKQFFDLIISDMEIPEFIDYCLANSQADSNFKFTWNSEKGCLVNLIDDKPLDFLCDLDYGSSEGIYLYIYVYSGHGYPVKLGAIKTLADTPEAMRDMGMLLGDFMLSYHKLACAMIQD